MSGTGRKLMSTLLLGLAVVLFVPAFMEAAAGFDGAGWAYADQVQLLLDYLPLLLVVVGLMIIALPMVRGGKA